MRTIPCVAPRRLLAVVACGVGLAGAAGLACLGPVRPAAAEEKKIAEPEDVTLQTGDGIELAATYYPGNKGKQTIPIVLLHGWKQKRTEFKELALRGRSWAMRWWCPTCAATAAARASKGAEGGFDRCGKDDFPRPVRPASRADGHRGHWWPSKISFGTRTTPAN